MSYVECFNKINKRPRTFISYLRVFVIQPEQARAEFQRN